MSIEGRAAVQRWLPPLLLFGAAADAGAALVIAGAYRALPAEPLPERLVLAVVLLAGAAVGALIALDPYRYRGIIPVAVTARAIAGLALIAFAPAPHTVAVAEVALALGIGGAALPLRR